MNDTASSEAHLTISLEELARRDFDVVVVGSGPAGVAVAERLVSARPGCTVAIVERGAILTLTHINNILPNELRRSFIDRFMVHPWEGSFANGGMLLPALGGRGIAAGAHLRRFDACDFGLWPEGHWPDDVVRELPRYYADAEIARRVSASGIRGPAQTWALGTLSDLHAHPPTIGVDLWSAGGFSVSRGYDSPVARLWRLLVQDALAPLPRHLFVATNAYAVGLEHSNDEVQGVRCIDTLPGGTKEPYVIKGRSIVLAASTVESARLILLAEFGPPATGRYLAEHIERRAKIRVASLAQEIESDGVSVVIPPETGDLADRFQIHLRGQARERGSLEIDIGAFAAMDPCEENRVTLSEKTECGVKRAGTFCQLSAGDHERVERMCHRIRKIAEILGGEFVSEKFPFEDRTPRYTDDSNAIQVMEMGRSYHEAGTLRMGSDQTTSVTDSHGKVHGTRNLHVADASLFPCVGVANPMLTITALAYRVADHIALDGC